MRGIRRRERNVIEGAEWDDEVLAELEPWLDYTANWQDMFKNSFLNKFTRVEGNELGAFVRTDGVQVHVVVEKWRRERLRSAHRYVANEHAQRHFLSLNQTPPSRFATPWQRSHRSTFAR
ncbi:hypothetical protein RI054_03g17000 [Pseudoscourfieldia marina]